MVPASSSTAPLEPPRSPSCRQTLRVVFFYFLIAGVATVMLGPALPLLAARWNLPDSRSGALFIVYFAGQFCGAWLATPRLRASVLLGAAASAVGLIAFAYADATTAHLALFFVGLGLGAGLAAGNVIVGTIDAADSPPDEVRVNLRVRPGGRGSSRS